MMNWVLDNLASIIVLTVVIAIITLVVIKMIKDKKNGKQNCSCGCEGCAFKDNCHTKN
ncbi:MAG: FeoB-associated Cys-rich membrane protein [Clostridia bacterium]|nr:FeoB-associated Cys-rich membrane protein [Clostridia bacterium]